MSRARTPGAIGVAILVFCRAALAACPGMDGASTSLAGIEPERRLMFVRQALEEDARRVGTWRWTWIGIGTGLTLANSTRAALAGSSDDRTDSIVAASSAVVLPTLLVVNPPAVLQDRDLLREQAGEDVPSRCSAPRPSWFAMPRTSVAVADR